MATCSRNRSAGGNDQFERVSCYNAGSKSIRGIDRSVGSQRNSCSVVNCQVVKNICSASANILVGCAITVDGAGSLCESSVVCPVTFHVMCESGCGKCGI